MTTKTPTAVYTCLDYARIEEYNTLTSALWDDYRAKIKVLEEELGVDTLLCSSGRRGQYITGYVAKDRHEEPKPGWRREAHSDYMKPALRTKAGKEIQARLHEVAYEPPKKPGLPDMVWGEGFIGGFAIEKINGEWFAYCTVPLGDEQKRASALREVDRTLWAPAKLSEYFLAAEAAEDKN